MICTFLSESEIKRYSQVSDKGLNTLFQEVRENFDNRYLLREITVKKKRGFFTSWFKEVKDETHYELYAHLDSIEVQVINFCIDWEYSINTVVPKSYIMAYFYGLLTGKKVV
jgi:hypothetical protein